jgi:hypothetical protein
MASQFDESDFVDADYQSAKGPYAATSAAGTAPLPPGNRPPTREELDLKVSDTQQKLAELKRTQDELERERIALEEARRRRIEFQTGREEMLHHLARGVGLLEEAEFALRRDAEQMSKSLLGLRDALAKVQSIQEETWNQENWRAELTRALTTIENARMEWNSARLKWQILNGAPSNVPGQQQVSLDAAVWRGQKFGQLCKVGLALTWPVAVIGLLGWALAVFLALTR